MTGQEKDKYLDELYIYSEKLNVLMDFLVSITEVEPINVEIEKVPTSLALFIREVIAGVQHNTEGETIIFVDNDDILTSALINQTLLRPILSSLFLNAIRYSVPGSIIHCQFWSSDVEVVFQIKDSGIGIPIEDQDRVFDQFYRGRNVGSIPGIGLGLTMVQQCLYLYRGSITLESKINIGTTVTLSLPC